VLKIFYKNVGFLAPCPIYNDATAYYIESVSCNIKNSYIVNLFIRCHCDLI